MMIFQHRKTGVWTYANQRFQSDRHYPKWRPYSYVVLFHYGAKQRPLDIDRAASRRMIEGMRA